MSVSSYASVTSSFLALSHFLAHLIKLLVVLCVNEWDNKERLSLTVYKRLRTAKIKKLKGFGLHKAHATQTLASLPTTDVIGRSPVQK